MPAKQSERLKRAHATIRRTLRRGRSACCGALIARDPNNGQFFCADCCQAINRKK